MKSIATILVLVGFIGLAVFGFAAMGHELGHGGCFTALAARVGGAVCPNGSDAYASAAFELGIFKNFSAAVMESAKPAGVFLYFLGFLLSLALALGLDQGSVLTGGNFGLAGAGAALLSSFPATQKFLRWLALHENSPAVAASSFQPSASG